MSLRVWSVLGGGVGDCCHDFLREHRFLKLASLVEDYDARVRIVLRCHCAGAEDLFAHHPHVHEVVSQPWQLPSAEETHYFNHPDGDWIPLHRSDLLARADVGMVRLVQPKLHLSQQEERLIARFTSQRPCIAVQPYAGLSDRDAFDRDSLQRLFESAWALNPETRFLVLGKNHDRAHKYSREECPEGDRRVLNLIDQIGIRVAWHLVRHVDAFCGAHSNLIRTAWDHHIRSACVIPDPLMTDHWGSLDQKYVYGLTQPEARLFTYAFAAGGEREFHTLDTDAVAKWLLKGE